MSTAGESGRNSRELRAVSPPERTKRGSRLLIVTHVVHFEMHDGIYGFAPYAREINVWARLFPRVTIAAPLRKGDPSGFSERLSSRVSMLPQPEVGGSGVAAKLRLLATTPAIAWNLIRAMRSADAVHVRVPGNLGLLGVLLAPVFAKRMVAKYAGQWSSYPGEALTVKFQRWLLRSRWWRGPVTVFARRDAAAGNIVPFFNSMMTKDLTKRASIAAAGRKRREGRPMRVVFVGRLSNEKNVDIVIRGFAKLVLAGARAELTIVGEGPEDDSLRELVRSLNLEKLVRFTGGLPFEGVLDELEQADVLTLVSQSEGFAKAMAEAMAFGVVCIGSDRGLLPDMMGDGRGLVVEPDDVDALAEALATLERDPDRVLEMSRRSAQWGAEYSLEALELKLAQMLSARWGVDCHVYPEMDSGTPATTV